MILHVSFALDFAAELDIVMVECIRANNPGSERSREGLLLGHSMMRNPILFLEMYCNKNGLGGTAY